MTELLGVEDVGEGMALPAGTRGTLAALPQISGGELNGKFWAGIRLARGRCVRLSDGTRLRVTPPRDGRGRGEPPFNGVVRKCGNVWAIVDEAEYWRHVVPLNGSKAVVL